ncbi:MAG: DUF2254 domain-containing protein [Hyphomicrobiaceae bacterium]
MWQLWVRVRTYIGGQMWLRPALASLGSVALAATALWFGRLYNGPLPIELSDEALKSLLSIFASSMLAVATFSVSAVVTAVSSVSNSTTPRASRLVLADSTTQNVLSSFIAAFIYSVIAILALEAYAFDRVGRFIIFVGLSAIVTWVLIAFVRWIDHVTKLGRVETGIEKITDVALEAMTPSNVGTWGAHVYDGAPPAAATVVAAREIGYVTELNVAGLHSLAERLGVAIYLRVRPGDFVDTKTPLAYLTPVSENVRANRNEVDEHIAITKGRVHGQDVRFGLINLAETADRALSPGINDPGTAIAILGRQLAVVTRWAEVSREKEAQEVRFDRVYVPPLKASEIVRDCFTPIARDGAGAVEVGIRLQKTLGALVRLDVRDLTDAALEMSDEALFLAEQSLVAETQKERVRAAAKEVNRLAMADTDAERNHSMGEIINF